MRDKLQSFFNRLADLEVFAFIVTSVRNKVLIAFLALALIPLVILGGFAFNIASNSLTEAAFSELEGLRVIKADAIRIYLQDREEELTTVTDRVAALQQEALDELETINQLKSNQLRRQVREWEDDVLTVSADPDVAAGMAGLAAGFEALGARRARALYGDKPELIAAPDDSSYSEAHAGQHGFFTGYIDIHDYEQAFLIDMAGNVVYNTGKGASFGADLTADPWQDSNLADLYGQLREASPGQVIMVDAARFEDEFVFFIGGPIYSSGRQIGLLVYELSFDSVNAIVAERRGQGITGETYLVARAPDNRIFFRSELATIGEGLYVPGFEATDLAPIYLVRAAAGVTGQGTFIAAANTPVLAAYRPLRMNNLTWSIISQINAEEALAFHLRGRENDIFTDFVQTNQFDDLYLFNSEGYAFYSVSKKPDYRTNLLTGPYQDSNLGRLVGQVLNTGQAGISDFERYAPNNNEPAAFMAQPVLDDIGQTAYVVALALPLDQITNIMHERTGLGESGETYLVGQDLLWRNDSRFLDQLNADTTVLNEEFQVNTVASRSALTGESGTQIIADYRGIPVLSSWAPIELAPPSEADPDGLTWAMMAEIDLAEVRQPVVNLAWLTGGVVVVAAIVVVLVALVLSGALVRQVEYIMSLFSEIGIGNFEARTEVIARDELGDLAASLNAMLDTLLGLVQTQEERDKIQASIAKLLDEVSGVAEGDLTAEAEVTAEMTGAIADSFNFMIGHLRQIIGNVQDTTVQVSASANEIRSTAEYLSQGSEAQAVQITAASTAVDEMSLSIQQVSETAAQSAEVAGWALANAQQGAQVVQETIASMNRIREQVQETAQRIVRLGKSSEEIGTIVQLIGDIADRTSILALNASIQAAMAGEAGKGFAVVAEEVEDLAEQATEATRQVTGIVKTIQSETTETLTAMEESQHEVIEGAHLVDQAGHALSEIETVSRELDELIRSISDASKQQAQGSENVARTMNEIAQVTRVTADGTKLAADSITALTNLADELRASVSTFKLPSPNGQAETEENLNPDVIIPYPSPTKEITHA